MGPERLPLSIRWPERFRPDRVPVHVRNEIEIEAPPEIPWSWLVRAAQWPDWYPNSADVVIERGGPNLSPGSRFRWRTFGVGLTSRVEDFERPSRLAWNARGTGVDVYHAWLITPSPAGCHVLTEESQFGALARIDHALRPARMQKWHQVWLENLRARSRTGAPPQTIELRASPSFQL